MITAGNAHPSPYESNPEGQPAASTACCRGSCSKPGGCACYPALPLGSLASLMFSCPEENVCLLQLRPSYSSTQLLAGTNTGLFKALLGKGAVRPNLHSLPGRCWIGDQCMFLFYKGKHSFPLQLKAGIYNEPNSAQFPISLAQTSIKRQVCLYSK